MKVATLLVTVFRCFNEGRALVICANKRDLVADVGVSARQFEKVGLNFFIIDYFISSAP